jgi:pSer/pThr/pTyr-binding forkhead associated (FHA) protein/tRNA A-37 threonylcarbamoyl transferase component Bud32
MLSGRLILTITAGPKIGKMFEFDEHDTLLVGRMADCQVCLPEDRTVSRHHILLEVNPPDARIRDLGSLHDTYVNGRKYGGREKHETPEEGAKRQYPQVDLHDGDTIKVGKTTFQVRVEAMVLPVRELRCQRCSKELSASAEQTASGDMLCEHCRQPVLQASLTQLPTVLPRSQLQEQQGLRLEDYEVEEQLGAGGMGAVYLARHKVTHEQIAVKVMLSKVRVSEQARKQFLREIAMTSALSHPHIVQFLGSGAEGDRFYFLLEYCAGGSMADFMKKRGGRLSLDEALPLLLQTLTGLEAVHAQGLVHRDLKPHNILLADREGQWIAKLSDLGLAKSFEQAGFSGMTATGGFAGSFPFMPREQVINFKRVQPTSDVWAMGATCYTLLTGAYPRHQQPGQDPLLVILQEESIPIRKRAPHIPAAIAEVIDLSLATKESERYQHAGDMYEALLKAWNVGR